ncbi:MAG TPA: ABC transporter substrate-binding protein [Ramlibacter sp.]|nr:ABC transporter substrate-binding protein [Ramlibacter sp.]
MKHTKLWIAGATLALAAAAAPAQNITASDNVIRIGVLNDRSGPIADVSGEGSALAARMAAEEFGNRIRGVPIEIVVADHQNKTDLGVSIARKWFDADGVDAVVDVAHSAVFLAVAALVKDRKKLLMGSGGSTEITGKQCTARSLQWLYNAHATTANVVTRENIAQGMDSFYIVAVDYALGVSMAKAFKTSVAANGGKIVGEVIHPINTTDFSSYLLQAQSSGAKGVLFANGGADLSNIVKQAREFGVPPKQQMLAAGLTTSEIESAGLAAMQGLQAVSFYEWNLNDRSRNWARAFAARHGGKLPSGVQASTYSEVRHYLRAIEAAGTDDADAVLAKMRAMPVDDAFASNGKLREDGQMVHDMYLVRIKGPSESTGKGDYTKVVQTLPGDRAFQTLAQSECPLIRK